MQGAVPDSEDIGQIRPAQRIHRNAVPSLCTRRQQGFDSRDDADAHDHHFARHDLAVGEPHTRSEPIHTLDAFNRRAEPYHDAMRSVLGLIEARQFLARHPGQHARQGFQYRHVLAELA